MGEWQNGLCGCFENCGLCVITYFCPCYTFAKNAEAVGDGCLICACIYFIPFINLVALLNVRKKVRDTKQIEGTCPGDCCVIFFCHFCALVQESQEMSSVGAPTQPMAIQRE